MTPYNRVQFNPSCIPLWVLSLALVVIANVLARTGGDAERFVLSSLGAAAAVLAGSVLTYQRIIHDLDALTVRYGPVPLFGKSLPYGSIESVEPVTRRDMLRTLLSPPWRTMVLTAGGKGAVRIRMKRQFRRWPTTFYAKEYVISCRDPEDLAQFVLGRMADWPPLYDYNHEFRPGCLLPALLIPVAATLAAAVFGWALVLGFGFIFAFVWVIQGSWLYAGYRVICFRDHLAVRQYRVNRAFIAYDAIESVDVSPLRHKRAPLWRTWKVGWQRPSLVLRLVPGANVRVCGIRMDAIGLRMRSPQELLSVLVEKNPDLHVFL